MVKVEDNVVSIYGAEDTCAIEIAKILVHLRRYYTRTIQRKRQKSNTVLFLRQQMRFRIYLASRRKGKCRDG